MDQSIIRTIFKNYYDLYPNSSSIAIANLTEFIYYQPSLDIDLKINIGDQIHTETVTHQAIINKKRVKKYKGNTVFGIAYYAISQPVLNEHELIGAITAVYPREPQAFLVPYLTVKSSDRWLPIHFDDVVYIEAQNRKTYVISGQRKGTHRYNLTELEMTLPANIYIRCHRSYIINLHQIKEIHPDSHSTFTLIMSDQSRVPVSQSYSKQFRKILGF